MGPLCIGLVCDCASFLSVGRDESSGFRLSRDPLGVEVGFTRSGIAFPDTQNAYACTLWPGRMRGWHGALRLRGMCCTNGAVG